MFNKYMFQTSDDVRYEDWQHYLELKDYKTSRSEIKNLTCLAVSSGCIAVMAILGAVMFSSILLTVISSVIASICGLTDTILLSVFLHNIKDPNNKLSKEQRKELKLELKALKRGGLWKEYEKTMYEYFASPKYREDFIANNSNNKVAEEAENLVAKTTKNVANKNVNGKKLNVEKADIEVEAQSVEEGSEITQ